MLLTRRFVPVPMGMLLIPLALAGCHKWVTAESGEITGRPVVAEDKLRVILHDGSRLVLSAPIEVEGDSLSGRDERERASSRPRQEERVRIALADIDALQRSRPNTGFTFAFIVLGVVAVGSVVLLLTTW